MWLLLVTIQCSWIFRDCSQSQKDEGNSFSQVYIHIGNFQVVVVSLGHDGNKIYKQVLFMHKVLVLLIDSWILKSSSLPSPLQVPKYLTHFFKLINSSEKGRNRWCFVIVAVKFSLKPKGKSFLVKSLIAPLKWYQTSTVVQICTCFINYVNYEL